MKRKTEYLIYLSYSAICAAIIAASALVTLPVAVVPITLQSFAVCAVAGLLGWKWGLVSLSVYVLLGALGLPVFSGFGGGLGVLLGASGGYILGFFATVIIVGLSSNKFGKRLITITISMAFGMVACYVIGTLWFVFGYAPETNLASAILTCVVPFIIPDIIKILVAALLVTRLKPYLKHKK